MSRQGRIKIDGNVSKRQLKKESRANDPALAGHSGLIAVVFLIT